MKETRIKIRKSLQLFVRLGCPSGPKQLECLRLLPASALLEVEAGFDGKKPKVRSPLWPLMPNGPAIDGTEEGLLDVPMKLVKQGCLWQNHQKQKKLDFAELTILNILQNSLDIMRTLSKSNMSQWHTFKENYKL